MLTLRQALDEHYCKDRLIEVSTYKRCVSECNRWERFTDNPDCNDIDKETVTDFVQVLREEGYSANTIGPNIKMIYYILSAAHSAGVISEMPVFDIQIRTEEPNPAPIPFEHLEAFLSHTDAAQWPLDREYWKRYIAFAYLTGLRRSDLRKVEKKHCSPHKIEIKANKTKKTHAYPMPFWLWRLIRDEPEGRLFPVNPKQIYQEMHRICNAAEVPYFTPKQLRILSVNEWENARECCGCVIQGAAIKGWSKATGNYLTKYSLLCRGIDKLRVPRPLLTEDELNKENADRSRWYDAFDKLPQNARENLLALTSTMINAPA